MSDATASVPSVQPTKLVRCNAGFSTNGKGWRELWINSPRTGNKISFTEACFDDLRKVAPRLIGRIAQARSTGQPFTEFTTAELHALVTLRQSLNHRSGTRSHGKAWGA